MDALKGDEVRLVTEDDTGLKVLRQPSDQNPTTSPAQIIE